MKLVRYRHNQIDHESTGVLIREEVIDLAAAWRIVGDDHTVNAIRYLRGDQDSYVRALRTAQLLGGLGHSRVRERMRVDELTAILCENLLAGMVGQLLGKLDSLAPDQYVDWRFPAAEVGLLAPVHPTSFRDFYAFEAHVRNARKRRGLEMLPEWYEAPVFYFSNTASILGPDAPIRKPPETRELDYELEIACVIGKEGGDIPVEEADSYVAGFTILNDWSARDLQRREMKVGLGPAKGKDFATSIGPWLVTPDELEDRVLPDRSRGKRYALTMTAAVNGREYSRGNARDMRWSFAELIATASRNTVLRPGDLIGSGTVGTGCITEFPEGTYPWLEPGDTVTLAIEGLGSLTNEVVEA